MTVLTRALVTGSRLLAALPVLMALVATPAAAQSGGGAAENAVVKIFATISSPDTRRPWTRQAPTEATGSGVVIEGRRILTNAHVVLYASQVQVQAHQSGDKVSATVVAVAPAIDLAVLRVDDESFFDTHRPLARAATLPGVSEPVLAYGFPTGGSSLSITKGIVSRIEFASYRFPVLGLRIQVDAAINPGNSGGPAVVADKMIGLAFATLNNAQNIGYIIPNEEIELFLQDIADGRYDGKPGLYDSFQTLENPSLRDYLKLDRTVEGVIVSQPASSDSTYPLKAWDVITHIGDTAIDNQGNVRLNNDVRVEFRYLVQKAARDGRLPVTVVRAGRVLRLDVPTSLDKPQLIPDLKGDYPPYFICGPVVFSKATQQFVAPLIANAPALARLGLSRSPLLTRAGDSPTADREELVVIAAPFFPHRLARGYSSHGGAVVRSLNGVQVRSLRHLVELLRDSKDTFLTFEFEGGGEALVFSRAELMASTEEILTTNGVRSQGSADMMAVWQPRTTK